MAHQLPQRRQMDLACHHLETIQQEKMTRETSQAVERRPGQILERHYLAEDNTRQARGDGILRPSPNYGALQLPNDDDHHYHLTTYKLQSGSELFNFSSSWAVFQLLPTWCWVWDHYDRTSRIPPSIFLGSPTHTKQHACVYPHNIFI